MNRLEYLEYFSGGPIRVKAIFKNEKCWISEQTTTALEISQLLEWFLENPGTTMHFDEHPYVVNQIRFLPETAQLKIYAERASELPAAP